MPSHGLHPSSEYLVAKPELEGGFKDLFHLLWSHEVDKSRFLHGSHGKKLTKLRHRWIIFVSITTQRMLMHLRSPLARAGNGLSLYLNLLSSNGGFFRLLRNSVTGRVVETDPTSSTFRSVIGNLDTRFDLDPRIVVGDEGYDAALSIMAARLSYENDAFIKMVVEEKWKMKLLDVYSFWNDFLEERDTRAFMLKDPKQDLIVVAFQGTNPFDAVAMRTDVDFSWYNHPGVGNIHRGFMYALGLQKEMGWPNEIDMGPAHLPFAYYTIRAQLRENKDARFILTGHSLGGALAILMAAVLMLHGEEELLHRLEGVYTFGQPRVGDEKFGEFMKEKLEAYDVKYCRYVYCNDIVPRLPYDDHTFIFKHFGPCLYYNSFYKGRVIEEVRNKNYFSLLWMIPKHLNAVWELIRGVILPLREGPDYREGCLLTILRLIGLFIPGIADHGPQDYTNITRLGVLSNSSSLDQKHPIPSFDTTD